MQCVALTEQRVAQTFPRASSLGSQLTPPDFLMETLIIGIDGGDRHIFESLPMPNMDRIMAAGHVVSVKEDLWARGWAEQLTGMPAHETDAYYRKPECGGSRKFVESYNGTDYEQDGIEPLWHRLNRMGKRVGFMNIPTTSPVPEVNGFFVGGAGGGSKKNGSATLEDFHCHPTKLRHELTEMGYILDIRFMDSGIKNVTELVDALCEMTRKRFDCFGHLCEEYQVDVGYICIRSLTVMQYLAMSELLPLLERQQIDGVEATRSETESILQKELLRLYRVFDDCLGRLFDRLSPCRWMINGDHGHVPILWKVNLNACLRRTRHQQAQGSSGLKRQIKRFAKTFIPRTMRRTAGLKMKSAVMLIGSDTNWSRTDAFCDMLYPGIYLYDERFGGRPFDEVERASVAGDIVKKLNDLPEFREHQFVARTYRNLLPDAKFNHRLPDVWVDTPDSYFFRVYGPMFEKNTDFRQIRSLDEVTNDMYTGMKGQHPMFCVSPNLSKLIRDDDPEDLRLIYRLAERAAE